MEALDLYSHTTPHLLRPAQLAEISTDIAQPLAAILVAPALADLGDDRTTRALLSSEHVAERMNVWVAVGMLMQRLTSSTTTPWPCSAGTPTLSKSTLDEVARQVTSKQLELNALLPRRLATIGAVLTPAAPVAGGPPPSVGPRPERRRSVGFSG